MIVSSCRINVERMESSDSTSRVVTFSSSSLLSSSLLCAEADEIMEVDVSTDAAEEE